MRWLAALCLLPLPAFAGSEPDTVKLKSGRILAGIVQVDDSHPEGFTVLSWDTGGMVFVRWGQISPAERARLVNRVTEQKSAEVLIDGVRAMTTGRDVVGVLVKEDMAGLHIKTKDSKSPLQVPRSALLRPHEKLRIPEAEAYSADERVDLRAARANLKDYAALVELGRFATSLRLFERAKEIYLKAAEADASKKPETDELLARNESLMREAKAAAMATQARELADAIEFPKAVELARKLLSDYAETEAAKQNKDLATQIEKRAKEYETRRAEFLARNVPQAYKDRRVSLFVQYAHSKLKVAEAMAKALKIDDELVAELARRFKATPDEIQSAWGKRELEPRTVVLGEVTWILKGGQDGGLDTPGKAPGDGFNPAVNLGRPLLKKEDWWAAASTYERRAFVESCYAKNSAALKKEIKVKKCVMCKGEGMFKETRLGIPCECKCQRCHGVKDDETIVYQ